MMKREKREISYGKKSVIFYWNVQENGEVKRRGIKTGRKKIYLQGHCGTGTDGVKGETDVWCNFGRYYWKPL